MIPHDTSPEMMEKQVDILRSKSIEEKHRMAFDMMELAREWIREGIRSRHPEYNEGQVHLAMLKATLPKNLFKAVYPDAGSISP